VRSAFQINQPRLDLKPKLVFTHTSEMLVITLLIITWNWRSSSLEI